MSDDAVEIKPTLFSNQLSANSVTLLSPARKGVAPWSPSPGARGMSTAGRIRETSTVNMLRLIAHKMSEAAPEGGILPFVVDFVVSVAPCDSCLVYVLEGDDFVLRASRNPHAAAMDRVKLKPGHETASWTTPHQPLELIQNAGADPRFKRFNKPSDESFEAFLFIPVVCRGRMVGAIILQNRGLRHYGEREIGMISTIGFLVGAETEIARLEEQNVELEERLRVRTLLERAKGLLQSDLGISEQEAYQRIQRQSQQMRKAMKDIAEAIVLSHAVKQSRPD